MGAKSKKNKVVSLTQTTKKKSLIKDKKSKFIEKIQQTVEEYETTFTLSYTNLTTLALQCLRQYFVEEGSVFIMGKNTLMSKALGKNEDDSCSPNIYKLSPHLKGNACLFFSNKKPQEIIKYFNEYSCPYFATAGTIANSTIILKRGIGKELSKFPSSMDSQFKELGLKFKLDGGKWYILEDFIVSKEGEKLTSEQAQMLRILDVRDYEFKINVTGYCEKNGNVEIFENKHFAVIGKKSRNDFEIEDEDMDIEI